MILDVIENAHHYVAMNEGFAKAVEFLLRSDIDKLTEDNYEIDGDRVFAMVVKDHGRKKENALLETHDKYIDIQFVLAGTDTMGWKSRSLCKQFSGEYDKDSDIQFFSDEPDVWLSAKQGVFAIFFPEDAHMPMISEGQLHKVVVKVAVDQP